MKTITASLYIAAKPEPIYDALTKAPGVAALLFGSRLETTFEPGAPYAYVGPDGSIADPDQALAYMVATNIVEGVWREAVGTRLTIARNSFILRLLASSRSIQSMRSE